MVASWRRGFVGGLLVVLLCLTGRTGSAAEVHGGTAAPGAQDAAAVAADLAPADQPASKPAGPTSPTPSEPRRQQVAPVSAPAAPASDRDPLSRLGTFSDVMMVLFTLALTVVAGLQYRLERRMAADTADSIRIADESAKAASRMADAMAAAERAYVFLEGTKPVVFSGEPHAMLCWRNYGKTPAVVVSVQFVCEPCAGFPAPLELRGAEYPTPAGTIIPAGGVLELGHPPLAEPRAHLAAGRSVYLYGSIIYRDVHQVERRSWFTRLFTGQNFILGLLHQPELNGYT